jgi:hypothetical protein
MALLLKQTAATDFYTCSFRQSKDKRLFYTDAHLFPHVRKVPDVKINLQITLRQGIQFFPLLFYRFAVNIFIVRHQLIDDTAGCDLDDAVSYGFY